MLSSAQQTLFPRSHWSCARGVRLSVSQQTSMGQGGQHWPQDHTIEKQAPRYEGEKSGFSSLKEEKKNFGALGFYAVPRDY